MRSFRGDVRIFCCNRAFHEENENNERDGDYGKNEKDVEVRKSRSIPQFATRGAPELSEQRKFRRCRLRYFKEP
jgi:hypothetical protein